MECPKGSECRESSHVVKTAQKATEWFDGATEHDLPLSIVKMIASNGRVMIKVYNTDNTLIHQRG